MSLLAAAAAIFQSASGGGPVVSISDQAIDSAGAGTRTAGLRLLASGELQGRVQTAYTTLETWLASGSAADCQTRLTKNSGTSPSGSALATWLNANATLEWTLTDSTANGVPATAACTLEIRRASDAAVLDAATVTITADRE